MAGNDRYDFLDRVIRDGSLPHIARLMYVYLDRRAGPGGSVFLKRETIAADLQICLREVSYCFRLLEHAFISTKQRRHHTEVMLAWRPQGLHHRASLEKFKGCTTVQGRVAPPCKPDPLPSLYETVFLNSPSCSAESSTIARDAPAPPAPPLEEPETLEDRLLIGLANRGFPTDCRMASKILAILDSIPVDWFLTESLDRELRRKHRLRKPFDIAWLPQAARDAVGAWRSARMARAHAARPAREAIA